MQSILVELNELNFKYVKKYFKNLKLDTLKKINEKLINTVSETEQELLEPWIQRVMEQKTMAFLDWEMLSIQKKDKFLRNQKKKNLKQGLYQQ